MKNTHSIVIVILYAIFYAIFTPFLIMALGNIGYLICALMVAIAIAIRFRSNSFMIGLLVAAPITLLLLANRMPIKYLVIWLLSPAIIAGFIGMFLPKEPNKKDGI
jgi:hypothetical protein